MTTLHEAAKPWNKADLDRRFQGKDAGYMEPIRGPVVDVFGKPKPEYVAISLAGWATPPDVHTNFGRDENDAIEAMTGEAIHGIGFVDAGKTWYVARVDYRGANESWQPRPAGTNLMWGRAREVWAARTKPHVEGTAVPTDAEFSHAARVLWREKATKLLSGRVPPVTEGKKNQWGIPGSIDYVRYGPGDFAPGGLKAPVGNYVATAAQNSKGGDVIAHPTTGRPVRVTHPVDPKGIIGTGDDWIQVPTGAWLYRLVQPVRIAPERTEALTAARPVVASILRGMALDGEGESSKARALVQDLKRAVLVNELPCIVARTAARLANALDDEGATGHGASELRDLVDQLGFNSDQISEEAVAAEDWGARPT